MTSTVPKHLCVGCHETEGVERVDDLGWVCDYCSEVIPIVFEAEIERVREARMALRRFVVELKASTIHR